MAKDPAFLFYPGDYLQDTQGMSEGSQVAYDRIICKHMLNIPITQQQVNYFTKRLTEDEKTEVYSVLKKVDGGFIVEWVAESISKRRAYSESRSKNRQGSHDKDMKTYVPHMVNENEIVNKDVIKVKKEKKVKTFVAPELSEFINYFLDNGFSQDLAQKAHEGYRVADWKDSKGNKVLNWKQKCQHVWFKESNKEKSSGSSLTDHYLNVGNQLGFNNTVDHE